VLVIGVVKSQRDGASSIRRDAEGEPGAGIDALADGGLVIDIEERYRQRSSPTQRWMPATGKAVSTFSPLAGADDAYSLKGPAQWRTPTNSAAIANDASALERLANAAIDETARMECRISPRSRKSWRPERAVIEVLRHAQAQAWCLYGSRRAQYCT